MKVVCVLALCALVLGVSGCGGSGRLSKSAYHAALMKIARESDAAHQSVERKELASTTPAEAVSVLRSFAATEDKLGDELGKLQAPSDAVAANAEFAKGEHDDASEIRALLPKLSSFGTVGDLFSYLKSIPQPKGGREQDAAISKLQELGYTSGS